MNLRSTLVCALILAACGDAALTSKTTDQQNASQPAACPTEPSGPCRTNGAVCEFGTDLALACDVVGVCDAGLLQLVPPASGSCPTEDAGTGPACPGYERSVDGGVCSLGATCDYPEGRCRCTSGLTGISWDCVDPGAACPDVRPRLGTPCSSDGQVCNYGACTFRDTGGAETCAGGIWAATAPPECP